MRLTNTGKTKIPATEAAKGRLEWIAMRPGERFLSFRSRHSWVDPKSAGMTEQRSQAGSLWGRGIAEIRLTAAQQR